MQMKAEDQFIRILTASYGIIDIAALRGERGAVELDLGCGRGNYAIKLAQRFPDRLVIAADVMIGRLRKLVRRREWLKLDNLDIMRVEAQLMVSRFLPDRCIDRLHLLCPDPWPKERHRSHRLMTDDFTTQLHRILKPGGILHFSSDDIPYRDSVEKILTNCGLFEPVPEAIADVADLKTDFETLWLGLGKDVKHYSFRTLPPPPPAAGH
ncbi:MAG: methyltransferase domain-containing protein [Victivallaceae bacterium]|nr:methyltransferase domain-containing protein [Victivallaceae bacterium]